MPFDPSWLEAAPIVSWLLKPVLRWFQFSSDPLLEVRVTEPPLGTGGDGYDWLYLQVENTGYRRAGAVQTAVNVQANMAIDDGPIHRLAWDLIGSEPVTVTEISKGFPALLPLFIRTHGFLSMYTSTVDECYIADAQCVIQHVKSPPVSVGGHRIQLTIHFERGRLRQGFYLIVTPPNQPMRLEYL